MDDQTFAAAFGGGSACGPAATISTLREGGEKLSCDPRWRSHRPTGSKYNFGNSFCIKNITLFENISQYLYETWLRGA